MLSEISRRFRVRRMRRFAREFNLTAQTRILDVGGLPDLWSGLAIQPRVTLLNTPRAAAEITNAQTWVAGDGRSLPFPDQSFDIVFSNSVIEHVGDSTSQQEFAREIVRVGRAYWVQTPNRWFPVEQHLLTPLIHWLPRTAQRAIVPRFTVWSAITRVPPLGRSFYLDHYLNDIRLLSPAELQSLFPSARIIRERFCGITKSVIAMSRFT